MQVRANPPKARRHANHIHWSVRLLLNASNMSKAMVSFFVTIRLACLMEQPLVRVPSWHPKVLALFEPHPTCSSIYVLLMDHVTRRSPGYSLLMDRGMLPGHILG